MVMHSLLIAAAAAASRLVGYAGQWRTWDVGSDPASPPALIDDSVNIRLWRITGGQQQHRLERSCRSK
jgi:hypothetical protein